MNWLSCQEFLVQGVWQGFCRELLLVFELLLVVFIVAGAIGEGNGVRLLFWHENPRKQFLAGLATVLLGSNLFFVSYLLHASEQGDWTKSVPGWPADSEARSAFWYVAGCWTTLVTIGIVIWCARKVWRHYKPAPPGRVEHVKGTPFLAASVLGIIGATPLIGFVLFKVSDVLRLSHLVVDPNNQQMVRLERLHGLAAALMLVMLLWYLLTAFSKWNIFNTPATGVCLLLGLVASAYGFLCFHLRHPSPTELAVLLHPIFMGAGLILLFLLGGLPRYKFRFRELAEYYSCGALVRVYDSVPMSMNWPISACQRLQGPPLPAGEAKAKQPVLLVCASGGGIRAAVWTAAVLCELEKHHRDFPYHVKLISGASGGMVGAGYYVASLLPPGDSKGWQHKVDTSLPPLPTGTNKPFASLPDSEQFLLRLADDMLSDVIKTMIFRDLPRMFVPFSLGTDRGQILQDVWGLNMGSAWRQTFEQLAEGERAGWRPSLVYSPMMVEDGRRLLISNLDLARLTTSRGPYVTGDDLYSRSAFEFFRLFPRAWNKFSVATAARMSASFPYFSPAGVLPTEPRRRLVDAGYFDNYGVTVAANWLDGILEDPQSLQALRDHASGVAIIEIRDSLSERGSDVQGIGSSPSNGIGSRGVEELISPPQGLLAARDSVSLYRNDEKLAWLGERFRRAGFADGFLTNVLYQCPKEAPLSWYLTNVEKEELIHAASAKGATAEPDWQAFSAWYQQRQHHSAA